MAPALGGATALSIVSLMALALTSLGVYGTIAQAVSRRTYEIGVRRALGARRHDILVQFLAEASFLSLAGDPEIARTIGKHRDGGLESQWLFAMTEASE